MPRLDKAVAELDALGALTPRTKLAHMVYVDDADIALLARRNVKISHCPTAGLKHIKGLAAHGRFVEMLDAGVCVSLGGDSAEVLESWLGIDAGEFANLKTGGVV